jgi:hypothetical protein
LGAEGEVDAASFRSASFRAQPDSVLFSELLVEMTHVQIEILLPVKIQSLLGLGLSAPACSWELRAARQQAIATAVFISLPQMTQLPVADV